MMLVSRFIGMPRVSAINDPRPRDAPDPGIGLGPGGSRRDRPARRPVREPASDIPRRNRCRMRARALPYWLSPGSSTVDVLRRSRSSTCWRISSATPAPEPEAVTRRTPRCARVVRYAPALLLGFVSAAPAIADDPPTRRVAAVVTEYRHNSHADVIVSRLLLTDMLDGTGRDSPLKLAALYTDQRPPNDISRLLAASHRFPITPSIAEGPHPRLRRARRGGRAPDRRARQLPVLRDGQPQYPKRRFWDETIRVFRESGASAGLHRQAPRRQLGRRPPHLRHRPGDEDPPDGRLVESRGPGAPARRRRPRRPHRADRRPDLRTRPTPTGFHALEAVQALAEQRAGGETGRPLRPVPRRRRRLEAAGSALCDPSCSRPPCAARPPSRRASP
jgi:hypothetical protein